MCEFCKNFDFGTAKAKVEHYGTIKHAGISFTGGYSRLEPKEQFNYCPVCGEKVKKERGFPTFKIKINGRDFIGVIEYTECNGDEFNLRFHGTLTLLNEEIGYYEN